MYSYFKSKDYKRVQRVTRQHLQGAQVLEGSMQARLLSSLTNSNYEIGVDWFTPFNRKKHSIGVVTMRWVPCMDCTLHSW